MPTSDLGTQHRRTRRITRLLILTGVLLIFTVIGCQIAEIEHSRTRPIWYDVHQRDGFEASSSPAKPWISLLGVTISGTSMLLIPALWIITIALNHKSPPHVPRGGVSAIGPVMLIARSPNSSAQTRRSRPSWNWRDSSVFVVSSIVLGLLSAAFLFTLFWDAMHHFRQDDNYFPRDSSLWWAEELSSCTVLLVLALIPGGLILAGLACLSGFRGAKRKSIPGHAKSQVASRFVVAGVSLLLLTWVLYLTSAIFLHRHDSWSESQSLSAQGVHDGIVSSVLTILASWTATLGIWSLLSAAIYELILIDLLGLTIRPALTPSTHAIASPPHPDS